MPTLRIADVLAGSGADWAAYLDSERVGRYTQNLDAMAPVVVFDTEDGLLLTDGYHRVAAAQQRGEQTIDAEVRHGSREDALRYAAELGAAQRGIPLQGRVGLHQTAQRPLERRALGTRRVDGKQSVAGDQAGPKARVELPRYSCP